MAQSRHQPDRPNWLCAASHAEWPCVRRRDELRAELQSRVNLAIPMVAFWILAARELNLPAAALHGRFLGWISGGS
jgi:hypothetical protein